MRPTRTPTAALIAVLALIATVVAACGAGAAPLAPVGQSSAEGYVADGAPEQPAPDALAGAERNRVYDADRADLLVIKTGSMELQVESVPTAVDAATTAIVGLGGYVSGSEQSGDDDKLYATLRFRIPAEAWEDALTALRGLAIKVVTERTQTEDVTGQVVDLRARIANLRTTEQALQSIMTQATKITDVLAVQAELTKVRGEIESLTAQRAHLEEQAAFSTLAVAFSREPDPAVVTSQEKFDPKSEVDRASASLVEVIQAAATAGIWFAIVWLPVLLVVGALGLIVAWVVRRRVPRRGGQGQPLDAGTTPPPDATA